MLVKYSNAMRYIQSGSGIESHLPSESLCLFLCGFPCLRNFCLQETVRESYPQVEEACGRVLELLHHRVHCLGSKKRPELALDIVQQLEQEGHFPSAH